MPRCLADRYGAASGAWGLDGSSGHSIRFSDARPGMDTAVMERTRQRARRARLSLVGVDCIVDVGTGGLEHGKALESVFRKTPRLRSQVGPLEDKRGRTAAERRRGNRSAFGLSGVHA